MLQLPLILWETARSFGNYDLALSLADLLDNSISAGASKINISVTFDGAFSSLKILDNGEGMRPQELQEAMRMASQNPKNERSKKRSWEDLDLA
jgi:HSP90 family molecular chaperone